MLIQITDAGVALMQGASSPLVMTSFKLGSSYGYTPQPDQTDIQGTEVYAGIPAEPVPSGPNTLLYASHVPSNAGPFEFGEVGLFYGATLFAICVLDTLVEKDPLDVNANTGGAVVIDFFVPITSTNYQMWANVTQANTIKASTVTGPEGLPPSPNALPNLYVVEPAGVGSTFMAYTDRFGIWSFVGFGQVGTTTVIAADANTITVSAASVAALTFQGLGTLLAQFTTGAAYSVVRYVDGMTPSGADVVLSFNAALTTIPNAGDQLFLYEPLATQTPTGASTSGNFTTLSSTGATSLGPAQAVSLNNTPIGAAAASSGRFTTLVATGATTLANLTAVAIEDTPIGGTTPAAGTFTELVATTSFSGPGIAAMFASPSPIGSVAPNSGAFTSLEVGGTSVLGAVQATSLDGAVIGGTTPAAATVTSLTSSGAASVNGLVNIGTSDLLAVTCTDIDASGVGSFDSLLVTSGVSFASINATPIGQTTAAEGTFTALTALGTADFNDVVAASINEATIGLTTPAEGKFTVLTALSVAAVNGLVNTGNSAMQGITCTTVVASGAGSFASLTVSGASSFASINSTPIGNTTPSTGAFTTLSATGATTLGIVTAGAATFTSINDTPIGATTPRSGAFTTLSATGATTLGGSLSAGATALASLDNTPIGDTTAAPGRFTTLSATGLLTANAGVALAGATGAISLNGQVGTAGQVLTSAGPGAVPTWTSVVTGGSSPTFNSLTVTGNTSLNTLTVNAINATPIGGTTPAAGTFTTLTSTSLNTATATLTGALTLGASAGAVGQVLLSAGPGVVPTWGDAVMVGSSPSFPGLTVTGTASIGTAALTTANVTTLTLVANNPLSINGSAGTLGQVLTSQGSGAAPVWQNLSVSVAAITSGSINGTTIGNTTPSTGVFTSLNLSGLTSPMLLTGSAGTLGQVLTSQGPGATPIWTTPSAGGGGGTVTITGGTIDGATIGGTNPADGTFVNLTVSGLTSLGSVSGAGASFVGIETGNSPFLVNGLAGTAGQVLTSAGPGSAPTWQTLTVTVAAISAGTISGVAITSSTLNGSPVGSATPSTGAFTTLTATSLDATPIGGTTPAAGAFTTLTATALTITGAAGPITLDSDTGTLGQVLTSAGPGATPTWETPVPDMTGVTAVVSAAGVLDIDCALGDYFTVALSEDITIITFSNAPSAGKGTTKYVRIIQDATARTVAWPASFKWAGGVPGAVSVGAGDVDVLEIKTFDSGTNWMAALANDFA